MNLQQRSLGQVVPSVFNSQQTIITIDTDKAKRALDHLHAKLQVQIERLQLAAQAIKRLETEVTLF